MYATTMAAFADEMNKIATAKQKVAFALNREHAAVLGLGGAVLGGVGGALAGGEGGRLKGGLYGAGAGGLTGATMGALGTVNLSSEALNFGVPMAAGTIAGLAGTSLKDDPELKRKGRYVSY